MSSIRRNIGAELTSRITGALEGLAAGSGDNTELSGATFDRASSQMPLSAKGIIAIEATLASGETATVSGNWQDSPNDSDWTDFGTAAAAAVLLTGVSGGGEARAVREIDVDLSNAERYVRLQSTCDLGASATDTSLMVQVLVFGGGDEVPAS